MNKSNLLSVDVSDFVKGGIVTFFTVVLAGVVKVLECGNIPDIEAMKPILITGLTAGASYILKNFLTNKDDKFLKK